MQVEKKQYKPKQKTSITVNAFPVLTCLIPTKTCELGTVLSSFYICAYEGMISWNNLTKIIQIS